MWSMCECVIRTCLIRACSAMLPYRPMLPASMATLPLIRYVVNICVGWPDDEEGAMVTCIWPLSGTPRRVKGLRGTPRDPSPFSDRDAASSHSLRSYPDLG